MKKKTLEIGLSANYVPKWGLWEGIREVIQNAKDREDLTRTPFRVNFNEEKKLLSIVNGNTILPDEIWTYGYSEKENFTGNKISVRGKWGEGLKLGCLSLLRSGKEVAVLNRNKKFKPTIQKSHLSGQQTLQIIVEDYPKYSMDFYFVIKGITLNEWDNIKRNFCFLDNKYIFPTQDGNELILDEHEAGNIYVDGIFIEHDPQIRFGYNICGNFVSLSRDRDKVYDTFKANIVPKMLADAICGDGNQQVREWLFSHMLAANINNSKYGQYKDLNGFFSYSSLPTIAPFFATQSDTKKEKVRRMIKGAVKNKILCRENSEAVDAPRFNKEGILVTSELYEIAKQIGYENIYERLVEKQAEGIKLRIIKLDELTDKQRNTFEHVSKIVRKACKPVLKRTQVYIADLENKLRGLYKNGVVYIDVNTLNSYGEAIVVLVHELSHQKGLDSSAGHILAMEEIYRNIFNILLKPTDKTEEQVAKKVELKPPMFKNGDKVRVKTLREIYETVPRFREKYNKYRDTYDAYKKFKKHYEQYFQTYYKEALGKTLTVTEANSANGPVYMGQHYLYLIDVVGDRASLEKTSEDIFIGAEK